MGKDAAEEAGSIRPDAGEAAETREATGRSALAETRKAAEGSAPVSRKPAGRSYGKPAQSSMRKKPRPAELDAKLKALAARAKRGDEEARIVLQTVALLSRTLDSPLSLQAMAESVYVSRTRLCTVFKRETGVSVGEFQSMMRMARAKTLLAKTDLPMSAIAAAVGFERQGSFTERFRECEGTTPLTWRRAYRCLIREKERREASMRSEVEKRPRS